MPAEHGRGTAVVNAATGSSGALPAGTAARLLADYDARQPQGDFADRDPALLSLDDAYRLQAEVAALRVARGERPVGHKVGCVGPAVQQQFGLTHPVRGVLWAGEWRTSAAPIAVGAYDRLAIEGEIALVLGSDPGDTLLNGAEGRIGWRPVIELHQYVFRHAPPTVQELVASNCLHAGVVALPLPWTTEGGALTDVEIRIEINGRVVDVSRCDAVPDGPLGSLRWLATDLRRGGGRLEAGDVILSGAPGPLLPVAAGDRVVVIAGGQRVEASFV